MKNVKEILRILQESLQGVDGKYSSKKLTLFLFSTLVLAIHLLYFYSLYQKVARETLAELTRSITDILMWDLSFLGALFGISTYGGIQMSKSSKETNGNIQEQDHVSTT